MVIAAGATAGDATTDNARCLLEWEHCRDRWGRDAHASREQGSSESTAALAPVSALAAGAAVAVHAGDDAAGAGVALRRSAVLGVHARATVAGSGRGRLAFPDRPRLARS